MNINKRNSIILNSLTEAAKSTEMISNVPAGYITVNLSTKGKVGAPELLHVRNFKVSEILTLSLSDDYELPIRLVEILNDMIYEDVDVAQWHEKEVEELMVYIFMNFYKGVLEDLPYPLSEEEYNFIEEKENGKEQVEALKSGKWVPKTSVNIAKDVDTFDLAEDFNSDITITNKTTGFFVTFGFIKYGDQITISRWLDSFFKNEETKFAKIKKQLDYNNGLTNQFKDSPDIIDKLILIDKDEEKAYKDYLVRRMQVISEVSRIVSIKNFNGEDVSNLSIGEKYQKLANDARIDCNLITKLAKRQDKMKFGIKPEVSMISPITREVVKRPLSFRIPSILQAMQLSGNDNYDDGYNDED